MKFRKGTSGNPRGAVAWTLTAEQIETIARMAAEGAERKAIAVVLGVHVRTLRKMERRDERVRAAFGPPPLTEEQIALIEQEASRASDEVYISRALNIAPQVFEQMTDKDPRVAAARAYGRSRLRRYLIRKLVDQGDTNPVPLMFLLKTLFGFNDRPGEALVNIDARRMDVSKMSDAELRQVAGLPPLPPEEPPSPAAHSSVPHPYPASVPALPRPMPMPMPMRAQPADVVPSLVVASPLTIEGRVVARTLKGQRVAERRREQARILASSGAFTKSMLPED